MADDRFTRCLHGYELCFSVSEAALDLGRYVDAVSAGNEASPGSALLDPVLTPYEPPFALPLVRERLENPQRELEKVLGRGRSGLPSGSGPNQVIAKTRR